MSLEETIERCEAIDTEAARQIAQAAQRLIQTADMGASDRQKEIKKLSSVWNVGRGRGTKGERLLSALKQELQAKLAKRASELHGASEPSTPMSAAPPSFCHVAAIETTLEKLREIKSNGTLLARVIDHACYSEDSISHAVVNMLQRAEVPVSYTHLPLPTILLV